MYQFKMKFQGKLAGFGVEEQLPTVAIISHYDSFGAAAVIFLEKWAKYTFFSTFSKYLNRICLLAGIRMRPAWLYY